MSLRARFLNLMLLNERRILSSGMPVAKTRAHFENQARLFLRPRRGATITARSLGPVPGLEVTGSDTQADGAILYFHGGAYAMGSPRTHLAVASSLALQTRLPVFLPDYSLAPEAAFPAAVLEAIAAYRALLDQGIASENIAIGGDSAGGGLALALLGEICASDLPKPGCCFVFSPWTDMTMSGVSWKTNAKVEAYLPVDRASEICGFYLAGADPTDPRASPLYADFEGACPVKIWVGAREVLLHDSLDLATRLEDQGVQAELSVDPKLPHAWPVFPAWILPEAGVSQAEAAAFITRSLDLGAKR